MNDTSNKASISVHWQYAAGQAFAALEAQVRNFNFEQYAAEHSFSGFQPRYFVEVIDGFLAEDSNVLPNGNRKVLQELRDLLEERLIEAFETGWRTATENWLASEQIYGSLPTPKLHLFAKEKSPFSQNQHEWFVEGFCQSWANEELQSLRKSES